MKKPLKVLIALVIIVAVAVGAYFLLNQGTDNKQIRAKVYDLHNSVIVEEENIFTKTNNTINEMLVLISVKGYDIADVQEYFVTYNETLSYYSRLKEEIIDNGVFVNNVNTNKYFDNMNKSYKNLVEIYKAGDEYLKGTYYTITNPSMYNKDYIVNFQNVFKDALKELNSFYFNAGMAFTMGVKDGFDTNNLYRLKVGYYCNAVNLYVTDCLEELGNKNALKNVATWKLAINDVNTYIENRAAIDDLYAAIKSMDVDVLIKEYAKGTLTDYINGLGEKEKSNAETYYSFVIGG